MAVSCRHCYFYRPTVPYLGPSVIQNLEFFWTLDKGDMLILNFLKGELQGLLLALEKAMAPLSSTLAWKIPWTEEVIGCSPWGR